MKFFTKKNTLVLISGCTQGLGRELSKQFSDFKCICINRQQSNSTDIIMDLSKPDIDLNLFSKLFNKFEIIIYINNASSVEPIKNIKNINKNDLDHMTNLHFLNPSKIILSILNLDKKFIILNITTGAAFTSNTKLALYSATKSAMHRFIAILKQEEIDNKNALYIDNFDPGRMQTGMQKTLIDQKDIKVPLNALKTPDQVAKKLFTIVEKELKDG